MSRSKLQEDELPVDCCLLLLQLPAVVVVVVVLVIVVVAKLANLDTI